MKSSYMILETELSPVEVDGLREVTRHAPEYLTLSEITEARAFTFFSPS
jgi:hypothetical protein